MTAAWTHLRRYLTRADALLLAAALAGLTGYVLLLPAQHPDAAASYGLGEAGALQAAEAFLAARGYGVEDLEATARLSRHPDLLNALQAGLGRRATRRLLDDPEDAAQMPAYHWRVRYQAPQADADEAAPRYRLGVTLQGAVWQFDRDPAPRFGPPPRQERPARRRATTPRADRSALRAAFAPPDAREAPAAQLDLNAFSDSLLAAVLAFDPADSLWSSRPPRLARQPDAAALRRALGQDVRAFFHPGFGPEVAAALARFHLGQTAWDAAAVRPDSAWMPAERGNRVARVRLVRTQPLYGQQVRADVTVSAAGTLEELRVAFNPEVAGQEATLLIVATVLQVAVYVLLVLVLVVAFFKRLIARLIDGKATLVDGAVAGLLAAGMVGLIRHLFGEAVGAIWLEWLMRALVVLVVGAAAALFTMVVSGAADSLARSKWPVKLRTASLVRLGSFRNVAVGRALLRGAMLAFVLLGATAALLALTPGAALHFTEESMVFLEEMAYQPMVWLAAGYGLLAYLVLLFVLLGAGTFVYHLWPRAAPVVGVTVVLMALMQGASVELAPIGYAWLLSGLWGVGLAVTFWRTDFLTCFTGFFLALLLWRLNEGWLVGASPAWMDVLLGGLLVLAVVGVGLLGVASGRTRREVAEYVPAYIDELTRHERFKRELEIARQVQASFLPRRMPEVEGLDIAAMCLAANEVGGDYYDFVQVGPGRLAVVVGDVSGKGTQAAFYMTLTKGFVQTLSREGLAPAEVMRRLNRLFYENAVRGTFISMIYGVFDVAARTFTFTRAGHNPVILRRSPGHAADLVQPTGLAIGLVTGPTFDETIEEVTIALCPGDVLVFYTDGFSEAMNQGKDLYGDDRLARKVGDAGQRSASEILRAVSEDVHHFVEAAGRHDDMTMVVVRLVPLDGAAPADAHRHAAEA